MVSVVTAAVGLKATGWNLVWLIVIPAVYLVFAAVWGQTANLLYPNFTWENEMYVIKQGMSVIVSMLGGVLGVFIPAIIFAVTQVNGFGGNENITLLAGNLVNILVTILVLGLSAFLYKRNIQKKI